MGDDLFYTAGWERGAQIEVRVSTPEGTYDLLDTTAQETTFLQTDGVDMIWQRLTEPNPDYTWGRVELWTAPYDTAPPVAGRFIRAIPEQASFVRLSAGRILHTQPDGSMTVRALSGELVRTLTVDAPGEFIDSSLSYCSDTEIGHPLSAPRFFPGHRAYRWVAR